MESDLLGGGWCGWRGLCLGKKALWLRLEKGCGFAIKVVKLDVLQRLRFWQIKKMSRNSSVFCIIIFVTCHLCQLSFGVVSGFSIVFIESIYSLLYSLWRQETSIRARMREKERLSFNTAFE